MKSKFTMVVMSMLVLVIIAVLVVFGMLIWQEIGGIDANAKVENFITDLTTLATGETTKTETSSVESHVNEIQSAFSNQSGEQQGNTKNYRYYYQQLNTTAKIFYDAFVANQDKMKTGVFQINFGNQFASILNQENGSKLLGDDYQSAIESYIYDNPEIFYISVSKLYLNIETTTRGTKKTYDVFINQGQSSDYLEEGYTSKEQISQTIAEIETVKNTVLAKKTGNTYQDIKMVHDYLVDTISYDRSISQPNIYNIYGALVNGVSVCEGYAKSFKYLMDQLQIPCTLVIGQGTNSSGETENHAWNYVQINNQWYAVDCTWDDPVVIGGGKVSNSAKYKYFLKGEKEMQKDHIPNGQFTAGGKIFNYPRLNSGNYK